jgi:hypothetical protein
MEKIVVIPKNKAMSAFLKTLLSKMDGVEDIEIMHDGEIKDVALLKKMKRNLKTGYTTREKVFGTLSKIINK